MESTLIIKEQYCHVFKQMFLSWWFPHIYIYIPPTAVFPIPCSDQLKVHRASVMTSNGPTHSQDISNCSSSQLRNVIMGTVTKHLHSKDTEGLSKANQSYSDKNSVALAAAPVSRLFSQPIKTIPEHHHYQVSKLSMNAWTFTGRWLGLIGKLWELKSTHLWVAETSGSWFEVKWSSKCIILLKKTYTSDIFFSKIILSILETALCIFEWSRQNAI